MTYVRDPQAEALMAAIASKSGRRSTFALGPHFPDSEERATLARVLHTARLEVLPRPAGRHRWSRGYHVRALADYLLRADGLPELADRVWACPMWRGRTATGREAAELATDGRIPDEGPEKA